LETLFRFFAPMWSALASLPALVLPVLLPSWRFFKSVEPSPRIEWGFGTEPEVWHPLFPPPETLSAWQITLRLFWNADRNDALFMLSCAERLIDRETAHSLTEIHARIRRAAVDHGTQAPAARFRIVTLDRDESGLRRDLCYLSDPFPLSA
jgi:hypothetical protein